MPNRLDEFVLMCSVRIFSFVNALENELRLGAAVGENSVEKRSFIPSLHARISHDQRNSLPPRVESSSLPCLVLQVESLDVAVDCAFAHATLAARRAVHQTRVTHVLFWLLDQSQINSRSGFFETITRYEERGVLQ